MTLFELTNQAVEEVEKNNQSHATTIYEFAINWVKKQMKPFTADDLKNALRDVISYSPLFAVQVIPVLLEKLGSSSGSAKKDSVDTISACLPVYGAEPFAKHLKEIWNVLKTEVFYIN